MEKEIKRGRPEVEVRQKNYSLKLLPEVKQAIDSKYGSVKQAIMILFELTLKEK